VPFDQTRFDIPSTHYFIMVLTVLIANKLREEKQNSDLGTLINIIKE